MPSSRKCRHTRRSQSPPSLSPISPSLPPISASLPRTPRSPQLRPPLFDDAAARIAAEANATAEALENLQRLLAHKLPDLERAAASGQDPEEHMVRPPPVLGPAPPWMRLDPPQFAASAPLLPLPVAPARSGGTGIYLLGFLAGLGLSLMAGAALYFFILTNAG